MARRIRIGARLRRAREASEVVPMRVCLDLGISLKRLSRMESGAIYTPAEYIPEFARLYGISIDDLIGSRRPRTTPAPQHTADAT